MAGALTTSSGAGTTSEIVVAELAAALYSALVDKRQRQPAGACEEMLRSLCSALVLARFFLLYARLT